jgi:hypothetical protein
MERQQVEETFVRAILVAIALLVPTVALADGSRTLFIQSAVEHADDTVTLPLYRGTSGGQTVWYVVFDSSDGADADALGVNNSQKLANARNSQAVQKVSIVKGTIDFPGTVNFALNHAVSLGAFPPAVAQFGSQADANYSPIIQLPNGTIRNAPQVANASGVHDKVVAIDYAGGTVTLRETHGFSGGNAVRYVSTDASDPLAAALEASTFVPRLNRAPFLDGDGTDSSRASLAAFVNGQTGAQNPQRQGLNSATIDGLDPLNILRWNPSQGRYAPLWDVHLAAWTPKAIAAGQNLRQTDYGDIIGLASHGLITAPDGSAFAASNFIVNCPIVSSE